MNKLFYGDNLDVLRDRTHFPDGCVDLIYLDPPFNSNANYNIPFKSPEGHDSESQIEAFEDTWHWNESAEDAFDEVMKSGNTDAFTLLRAMREFLGDNDIVTHLAIGLIEKRMKEAFPGVHFEVKGRPQSLAAAQNLAERDKHQFELWALSVVDADPWKGGRKGPDGGIDGIIWFKPDGKKTEKAIVEVKGGSTGVKDIGRLAQVMERENAKIGVLITAQNPTRKMESDAAAVGMWENEYTGRKHARLQIITLAELFQNKRPDIPWVDTSAQKKAKREEMVKQGSLL